jgi:hypothetical protein
MDLGCLNIETGETQLLIFNLTCEYWQHVSVITDTTGEKKYTNLSFIAKAALSLSHGNASPERGFSVNNSLLTDERGSLAERSIIAQRVVKEAIRLYGSVPQIPMTKEVVDAVKSSTWGVC